MSIPNSFYPLSNCKHLELLFDEFTSIFRKLICANFYYRTLFRIIRFLLRIEFCYDFIVIVQYFTYAIFSRKPTYFTIIKDLYFIT